jgi:hypothetical protein
MGEVKRRQSGATNSYGISTYSMVSFFVRPGPFLRPDLDLAEAPRAAAVKAGRHCGRATDSAVARPRLDGGEHGARLEGRDDLVAT